MKTQTKLTSQEIKLLKILNSLNIIELGPIEVFYDERYCYPKEFYKVKIK